MSSSQQPQELETIIVLSLQMRKLRPREVKSFSQGHSTQVAVRGRRRSQASLYWILAHVGTEQPVNSLPQVLNSLNYSCSFHYLLIPGFSTTPCLPCEGWADLSWSLWCFQKLVLGIAHSKCLVI